jgi:hypothetical protein
LSALLQRRLCLRAIACGVLAGAGARAATPAHAEPAAPAALERSVKAAFLYKFLGYTEYPASAFADPTSPIVIGVLGSEDMSAELVRIVQGRSVNNRPLQVRSLHEGDSLSGVHLLFIAGADNGRAARALRGLAAGALLVTECENGLQLGSVINFKIVEERVRFDVSLEAADKNNVKLSSRLLTVANHVIKGAP